MLKRTGTCSKARGGDLSRTVFLVINHTQRSIPKHKLVMHWTRIKPTVKGAI
jgi:hypothetical protein